MSSKKIKLTPEKIKELKEELSVLRTKGRRDISERLTDVQRDNKAEFEDPYGEVTEDRLYLEKRIKEIKEILSNSEKIEKGDTSKHSVQIGSTVTVGMESFQNSYQIVDPLEADPLNGKISIESPVGKALIGSSVGDIVQIETGGGISKLRILRIE